MLLQVYPTLAALAGLPVPQIGCDDPGTCVEGDSAEPLLEQAELRAPGKWKKASISQYARCSENAQTGYYSLK